MDQRALASGGKILRRNGDGKGRYLVSGRDQRAQPSADGRERSGAWRSELHGRPQFCAARRATAAGRSPGGGVVGLLLAVEAGAAGAYLALKQSGSDSEEGF